MIKKNTLLQRGKKRFWSSKSGGVLVYVAFGLPILLGAMALSIDLGRAFILNTELKDFSDAAALAGAAELDGRDGAMVAAESAARTGISGALVNIQGFATDGSGANIVVDDVVFLKKLPRDGTAFVLADTATTDAEARFIFVSVVNRNVRSGLSRALGAIPDFNTSAKSIAGFNQVICEVPAMFMCNPLEADGTQVTNGGQIVPAFPLEGTLCEGLESTYLGEGKPLVEACLRGRGMALKDGGGGGGADYFPGEFGLLGCPKGIYTQGASQNENQGIKCVAETIAQATPPTCVTAWAFPQTGQGAGPIRQAVNTRFDIYENPQFGNGGPGIDPVDDPRYRPALNVTKGYKPGPGGNCAVVADPSVDAVAKLPRDACFSDPTPCKRYGDGNWQAGGAGENYWTKNHPGQPSANIETDPDNATGKPYSDMTRYEVYRYEIDTMWFGTDGDNLPGIPRPAGLASPAGNGTAVEKGLSCQYSPGNPLDPQWPDFSDPKIGSGDDINIDRRLLVLAAVNCVEHGPLQGAQPDGVRVEGYVEVFLTEPTTQGGPEGLQVWGEIKGVLEGDEGLKDIVQLYR